MFLALREMRHAKLRYVLIGAIMILIAWLVLFVSGLAKGLASDNASSIQTMDANYFILEKGADHRLNRSTIQEDKWLGLQKHIDDSLSAPFSIKMAIITKGESAKKIDTTLFAIDVNSILAPAVVEGKMIDNVTSNEVVADYSLKDEGLQVGDYVTDEASGKTFKIVGFTKEQAFSHTPVLHMNFKAWALVQNKIFNEQAVPNQKLFNAIALNISQDQAEQLSNNVSAFEIISKDQALKGIPGYKEEQGSLFMMIAFLFVIAAFVLAVFFYVMTIQKMNQFGVLKAIGATSSYLARNVILQVLMLSIVSLVIGIALTYGVSFLLPSSMPFNLSLPLVLGCSLLFLAVSVLGSLFSLYRVAKIDAIDAIGRAV